MFTTQQNILSQNVAKTKMINNLNDKINNVDENLINNVKKIVVDVKHIYRVDIFEIIINVTQKNVDENDVKNFS